MIGAISFVVTFRLMEIDWDTALLSGRY
eukprot:COSAG06_NODE_9765_length_1822_cov_12.497388_2_plen_27_part_01